jgi:hypothetical protein
MQLISRLEQEKRLDKLVAAGQRAARLIRPGKVRDACATVSGESTATRKRADKRQALAASVQARRGCPGDPGPFCVRLGNPASA